MKLNIFEVDCYIVKIKKLLKTFLNAIIKRKRN